MKVTGFTIVRNAIKFDYPIVEAISSILPICDEFIVLVGDSEDETLQTILSIPSPKLKVFQSVWDDNLRTGGKVLADETNKAMKNISEDSDWAFYIQADEVVHESYLNLIRNSMLKHLRDYKVDGLLFKYLHFYGSYDYIGESNSWYRNEIRIIRNRNEIYSFGDAQGFRKLDNQKLNVMPIDAYIYHYGWVKDPKAQQNKALTFNKFWHDDDWIENNIKTNKEFDYTGIDALKKFEDNHPAIMINRINRKNWSFDFDISKNNFSFREKIQRLIERLIGIRIGEYKNYKLID